jgi:hypothetical protein
MSGKIDWVSLNPMPAPKALELSPSGNASLFKRDVLPLGHEAERNHTRLSQYVSQLNALRRNEA